MSARRPARPSWRGWTRRACSGRSATTATGSGTATGAGRSSSPGSPSSGGSPCGSSPSPPIEALEEAEITVYPDSWRRETIRWLENIHDWNVSRQLWWGHRIPVWYGPEGEVVASKESPGEGYEQDPDVLDTWFSTGLWPFATLGWPERPRTSRTSTRRASSRRRARSCTSGWRA